MAAAKSVGKTRAPRRAARRSHQKAVAEVRTRFLAPFADLRDQLAAARTAASYPFFDCVDVATAAESGAAPVVLVANDYLGLSADPRVREAARARSGAVRHQPLRFAARRRLHDGAPGVWNSAWPTSSSRTTRSLFRLRLPGQRRQSISALMRPRRSDRHRPLQPRLDRRRRPPLGCRRALLPTQQRRPSRCDARARGGGPAHPGDRRGHLQRRRRHRGSARALCAVAHALRRADA